MSLPLELVAHDPEGTLVTLDFASGPDARQVLTQLLQLCHKWWDIQGYYDFRLRPMEVSMPQDATAPVPSACPETFTPAWETISTWDNAIGAKTSYQIGSFDGLWYAQAHSTFLFAERRPTGPFPAREAALSRVLAWTPATSTAQAQVSANSAKVAQQPAMPAISPESLGASIPF